MNGLQELIKYIQEVQQSAVILGATPLETRFLDQFRTKAVEILEKDKGPYNGKSKVIALDFDGTVVKHEFPHIGESIGAERVLKRLVYEGGHRLILNTMRSGRYLTDAEQWFKERDIPLYGTMFNPKQVSWTSSTKCYADVYIDDAALGCPLINKGTGKAYVDWAAVEDWLEGQGLLDPSTTLTK